MSEVEKTSTPEAPGPQPPDPEPMGGGDGDAPDPLTPEQAQIAELQASLEASQAQFSETQARLRMVSKKYDDLQKEWKTFRERNEARATVNAELQAFTLAKQFFDPVMNLKRSLAAATEERGGFADGVRMVHQQFMDALGRLGLEEVPGEGAPFDPTVHEALAVTPVTDPAQDGIVLVVHTAGYSVKGRVLQAAQVVIGKLQDGDTGEE